MLDVIRRGLIMQTVQSVSAEKDYSDAFRNYVDKFNRMYYRGVANSPLCFDDYEEVGNAVYKASYSTYAALYGTFLNFGMAIRRAI